MIFWPVFVQAGEQNPADALAPHKALYEVRLLSKKSGSQIVNIDGKMFYEWHRGCEAWNTNHRLNVLYEYTDSPSMHITSDLSTHESFDGLNLDFSSRRMRDGELFEEIRGSATRDEEGGMASFRVPEKMEMELPADTFFPMGHTIHILDMFSKGKKIDSAVIFDGSDEEGARQVNTFMGNSASVPEEVKNNPHVDKGLLKEKPNHMRLAFFLLSDPSSIAEYEMDILFHRNGVISSMAVDYRDFSVSYKLTALEPVDDVCNPDDAK